MNTDFKEYSERFEKIYNKNDRKLEYYFFVNTTIFQSISKNQFSKNYRYYQTIQGNIDHQSQ